MNFAASMFVKCGYDTWAERQPAHLPHNIAKSNLYSCRSIMPKNVLASLALHVSWCSSALCIVNLGLKCWKLHWHTSQQTSKCPHAACTPQSLESDQSDTAICAPVKVSDYYTADSSSWICVRLTTVSSNHDSLNQNKHLGSIIPCWKPLIVNSQSTLSGAGLSTELCTNALFLNRHTVHLRNTLPLIYLFGVNRSKRIILLRIVVALK